jgi:O-antigen ligase
VFAKIQEATKRIWLKLTQRSFITKWFSCFPKSKDTLEASCVFKIYNKLWTFVSKIFLWFSKIIKKSYIISHLIEWYKNFFKVSIRGYSLFIIGLALPFTIMQFIQGDFTNLTTIISYILLIGGLIGCFINKSILTIISSSFISKFICKFFDYNLQDSTNTQQCSKTYLLTHFAIGLICSLFSIFTHSIILPLLIFGLLGVGVLWMDYRIGLFSAIILVPILPSMAVVCLLAASFFFFLVHALTNKEFKFVRTPLDIPIAIFAIIILFSTVTSYEIISSTKVFLAYFMFMLSYYMITNSIKTKKQLYSIIYSMLFVGVIVALYGIYQYVFGFAEGTIWTDNDMFNIKTRVVSTFSNPNVLGEYLLLLLPISMGYILSRKNYHGKAFNLIATALLGLCMIFTYSRGNWIGLIVATILFFMFYNGKFVWWGMLLMLFVPLFLPETIMDRLLSIGNTADTSTSYRVSIWYGTCRMLKDYWLTGVGLGTHAFNKVYPNYAYANVVSQHPHNVYLHFLSENGIFGLLIFVIIIFIFYKMCISTILKTNNDKMLKCTITGFAAGIFGYLVQGMFDQIWYNYRIVFIFFVLLALTCCATIIHKNNLEVNKHEK